MKPVRPTRLYSRLGEIAAELPSRVDAALKQGAELVAADAETRLEPHRLSGELELQIEVDDQHRRGIYVHAGDRKDPSFAFYAHFLEFGTSHSPSYPFLVPALEDNEDAIKDLVRVAVLRTL